MSKNKSLFHNISTRIVKLINLVLMTAPFAVIWYRFYADQLWVKFWRRGHWLVILLFVILYFVIGRIYEAFKMSYTSKGEIIYSQMLSLFEVDFIMYIVAWLLIRHAPSVIPMLIVLAVQLVISTVWTFLAH